MKKDAHKLDSKRMNIQHNLNIKNKYMYLTYFILYIILSFLFYRFI